MRSTRLAVLLFVASGCASSSGARAPVAEASAAIAAPAPVARPTPSPALLVVNKGHRDATHPSELAILDPDSGTVVARIPTGMESHEVATSADGALAVVSNTGPYSHPGHTLSVIDVRAQKEIHRVELGPLPNPHGVVWNDGRFWFTAEGAKLVGRYDPATNAVDWMMGIGQDSIHMLVFSKDGKKMYTADRGSASVAVVSLAAPGGPGGHGNHAPNPLIVPVESGPEGIDLTPDGSQVWVGCHGAISIIDTATDKVIGRIDTGSAPINRLKFTLDGKHLLATQWNGPVMVFDVATRKQVAHVDAVVSGSSILIAPDGLHAYVDVTDKDTIYVIDLTRNELVRELHSGEGPDGLSWVQAR